MQFGIVSLLLYFGHYQKNFSLNDMNIKHLFILFIAVGTLVSCSKDENDTDKLIGSWESIS